MASKIENPIETMIGAAVLLAAAGFAFFAASSGGVGVSSGGYAVKAMFQSASGVNVGTDVRIAGVKVGRVTDISLDPKSYRAEALLTIENDVELPVDTLAKIDSEGILGGSFIALEPGAEEQMLAAGDAIELTQGAVSLLDLISKFGASSGGDK